MVAAGNVHVAYGVDDETVVQQCMVETDEGRQRRLVGSP